jgi:hypothetical protein
MKNQGQILANVGSSGSAVVAWDRLSRDEVLDVLDAVVNFLELKGNSKDRFKAVGLRSGRHVQFTQVGKPDFADLGS